MPGQGSIHHLPDVLMLYSFDLFVSFFVYICGVKSVILFYQTSTMPALEVSGVDLFAAISKKSFSTHIDFCF